MRKIYLDSKTIIYFGICLILSLGIVFLYSYKLPDFGINLLRIFFSPLLIILLFAFNFFTIYKIINMFKDNEIILLRYHKKIDYFRLCISNSLKSSILYYIIFVSFIILFTFIFSKNIGNTLYYYYGISSFLYLVLYLIRLFAILYLIALISAFIMQFINNKIVYIVPLIFPFVLLLSSGNINVNIDSILDFKFNFVYYLSYNHYSSFILEIFMSLLYIMLLVGVLIFIIKLFLNRKSILNIKYLVMKYLSLFKKYIIKYYIVYILICLFVFFLYFTESFSNELYIQMFGYSFKNLITLVMIFKIFSIIFFIFCSYILCKKINNESYEFLYLRINKRKLFIINIILSCLVLIIMRFIIYMVIGLLFYIESSIFMFDYSYLIYDFILIIIINIIISFVVKFKNHI